MPTHRTAETPSPYVALLMVSAVHSQPRRCVCRVETNGVQSKSKVGTGIEITRQNKPNWVGRWVTECKGPAARLSEQAWRGVER